ncbi:hypothetical protein [Lachnobacterium bovis]|uniref:Nucleotidyl transferase AbiEii toxin, Type IV TA system n=1 Tax=Lachnobacterium bovis TaxID=140626 RepID=A0A1H9TZZ3_9FIRM|nr:hypothetical protein [Lachnobacterium bovis]SES02699.1 hypothetical protein SAMN02910429_01859 [Lachnobacterium bovis]
MKIGVEKNTRIKEKSGKLNLNYTMALRYFAIEEIISRIYESEYNENLYFVNPFIMSFDSNTERESLNFYYIKNNIKNKKKTTFKGKNPKEELCCADLDVVFAKKMLINIMKNNKYSEIKWNAEFYFQEDDVQWNLEAVYEQMIIPITVHIRPLFDSVQKKEYLAYEYSFLDNKDKVDILIYPKERIVVDNMFEIVGKLELIDSMEYYYILNEILKRDTLSGMHLIDYAKNNINDRIKNMQYFSKLKEYKKYAYMKKRWDKYLSNKKLKSDSWEIAIERILNFIEPIWTAYCKNEILVKDWMPDLNRFLG